MIIFLAAALPQFVDRGGGQLPLQMLLLGLLVAVIALVSDSLWALAAGTARSWVADSPRRIELLGATGGLAMIGIGVSLAASGRNPGVERAPGEALARQRVLTPDIIAFPSPHRAQ